MKKYLFLLIIQFLVILIFAQTKNIDFFLDNAKQNSPVLYSLNNNLRLYSVDLQRIKAIYAKPQIIADAGLLFAPIISTDNNKTNFQPISQGATDYFGYDLGYTDGGQYNATASINQPLFNKNKISVYEQQTKIQQQTNSNNIHLSDNELDFSVTYQYLLCLTAKKQLNYSIENSNLLLQEILIMRQLVESGIYQQSDLSLLQIEQKTYLVQSENYSSNYSENIADLLVLCGISDTSVFELDDLNLELKTIKDDSLLIEKYRLDSLNIFVSQEIWNLRYKPQISAFANVGINSIYLPNYKRFGFGFGLKFSWLLFDGKQKKLIEQQNKILSENNSFSKNNFIFQNQIRKRNLLNRIESLNKQINIIDEQLLDYENLLSLYKLKVSQGQMSIINFVDILKKISDTKQQKLTLKMQQQILINTFNYWNN